MVRKLEVYLQEYKVKKKSIVKHTCTISIYKSFHMMLFKNMSSNFSFKGHEGVALPIFFW